MITVEELYKEFCLMTDTEDIEQPYLSEETNYMIAFDKWGSELEIDDLRSDFQLDVSEDELEQIKKNISDFVSSYFLKGSKCKPIGA